MGKKKKGSDNGGQNSERIDGLHIDYLSFTDWRDRIKAGLCQCTDAEHAILDPNDELGANVQCSRTQLCQEILKDLGPRTAWGIAEDLAQAFLHLAHQRCWDVFQDQPVGPDGQSFDDRAAAILNDLAELEAKDAELNREWYRQREAEGRDEGDDEAA